MGTALLHNRVIKTEVNPVVPLNDNSWKTISKVSDTSQGENYWAIGDTKEITINGMVGNTQISNLSVWAYIIGFDHNNEIEGKGQIHFLIGKTAQNQGMDICLVDSLYGSKSTSAGNFNMNYSSTNVGGWASSKMRTVLLGNSSVPNSPVSGSFMAALPSDLLAKMKPCTKYTDNTAGGKDTASYVTATTDYLWLLSEYEVTGSRQFANSAEQKYQKQYYYYELGNSRIKHRLDANNAGVHWWLRSVEAGNAIYFCFVRNVATTFFNDATYSFGVAPAFCV